MARTIDETAHTRRRDALLDVAEQLLREKGYENVSIADVLVRADVSRGAFYHYFESKQALLEALLDRMVSRVAAELQPVSRTSAPAVQQLSSFFSTLSRWKVQRQPLLIELLTAWWSDHNALARDRLRRKIINAVSPIMAEIIENGVHNAQMNASDSRQTARIVIMLIQDFNETMAVLVLTRGASQVGTGEIDAATAAFNQAVARVLGIDDHRIKLVDPAVLRHWLNDMVQHEGKPS